MSKKLAVSGILSISLPPLLIGAAVYYGAAIGREAETTLHAFALVLDVVGKHICAHSGQWPASWDDLAKTSPDRNHPSFVWPDDVAKVKKRIRIHFGVTTAKVIATGRDQFMAVKQIGPNYGPHEGFTYPFFEVIKKCGVGSKNVESGNDRSRPDTK